MGLPKSYLKPVKQMNAIAQAGAAGNHLLIIWRSCVNREGVAGRVQYCSVKRVWGVWGVWEVGKLRERDSSLSEQY
ncbi:MAG: hypothetical protein F6K41_17945 [Symploca sp. SIO3E6]|nr:hypothetical protein [Caldora sp. SIO3E6]